MKKLAFYVFWSFLVFGLLFIFLGGFLMATGRGSEGTRELILLIGGGQLLWFLAILFFGKRPTLD